MSHYGWIRDLPDQRDYILSDVISHISIDFKLKRYPKEGVSALPTSINLLNTMPDVYDQGQIGSCTGNAIAAVIQYDLMKQNEYYEVSHTQQPSRLFLYYNGRYIEGTQSYDCGAQLRDVMKGAVQYGSVSEQSYSYDLSHVTSCPPGAEYVTAKLHKLMQYASIVQTESVIKTVLASNYPIAFGIVVYSSFETDQVTQTGQVPMPTSSDSSIGGHAVVLIGYDDSTQKFLVRNSWGNSWGMNGYFTLPYEYVLSPGLASDFWVVNTVH